MNIKLSKKAKIIIISIHLVALAVIVYMAYGLIKYGEEYRRDLGYSYSQSLGELSENLGEMEQSLNLAKYVSTTTGVSAIATDLFESSGSAKTAISHLPFSENNSKEIEKSLSVIGDFSLYIQNKISADKTLSSEDYEGFKLLSKHCEEIKNIFTEIQSKIGNKEASVGDTREVLSKTLNLPSLENFDVGLDEVSSNISALPKPIYDGVFSQSATKTESVFLKKEDEIDENKAREIATEFLKNDSENITLSYEDNGVLASYQFTNGDESIKISKFGGKIIYYKNSVDVPESILQYNDVVSIAKEELKKLGYEKMIDVKNTVSDNVCVIDFVPTQDGVLIYSDIVTVSLELGEGGIIELSSDNYMLNHFDREIKSPSLTHEKASEIINPTLDIVSSNFAIIPSNGNEEIMCYEFLCEDENGTKVKIFINANTGLEERILIV